MKSLLSLLIALALIPQAVAQTAKPATGAPREKVLQLMEVMRIRQQLDSMVTGMREVARNSATERFKKRIPDATAEDLAFIASLIDDMFRQTLQLDDVVERFVPIYQKHLTVEEIDASIAFYSSPAGKSLLEKAPAMMQEGIAVGSALARERLDAAEDQLEARIREYFANRKPAATDKKP
jgi:hypothetical protein